jgi:hypothetical protein
MLMPQDGGYRGSMKDGDQESLEAYRKIIKSKNEYLQSQAGKITAGEENRLLMEINMLLERLERLEEKKRGKP